MRTGYSAIADEWIGIRPGTDGLFVLSLVHELLRADKVDFAYLGRYTNAAWLVIRAPGAADDGLFARNEAGEPLVLDAAGGLAGGAPDRGRGRASSARRRCPTAAAPYRCSSCSPSAISTRATPPRQSRRRCGIPAERIRSLAAEIANVAFEQEIEIAQPWTDWAGRRHETMRGRPVSIHAMRGISAHSNGFQTCRALHLLQILLGTIDVPGGWRYKSPYPKPAPPGPKPAGKPGQVAAGKPLAGAPLGFPMGPEDLLLDADGRPQRIDKAFSWEAPIAAHGLMQMVIRNAWHGDPYPIDTLFMYMANMAWNSAMNTAETIRMLTDKDPATGEYKIPRIIYSDAYYSETVAYADLVLPDTTYLERWDCISLLDRPIGGADGPGDAIRQPVIAPDRDVRPFQDVLIELGARLGLPAFVDAEGGPRYPGGYKDYIALHERTPGHRAARRLARRGRRRRPARARRTRTSSTATSPMAASGNTNCRRSSCSTSTPTRPISKPPTAMGLIGSPSRSSCSFMSSPCSASAWRPRAMAPVVPPEKDRERIATYFDPLPFWYAPFESSAHRRGRLPAARDHPAADADVPFLALAERLAAPDPRPEPAVHQPGDGARPRPRRRRLGLGVEPCRPDPAARSS